MSNGFVVDDTVPSRELVRTLRGGVSRFEGMLPESVAWQTYLELHRRGEPDATPLFLGALRSLHSRRSIAGSSLPITDGQVEEHRMTGDSMLGELWKAYKKCIRSNRTGPAGEILKEIENRLATPIC